jgi:putative acetyltransferase
MRCLPERPNAACDTIEPGGAGILTIGLSRLYLGVHFLSDVIGGYAAGAVWLAASVTGIEIARRQRGHAPRSGSSGEARPVFLDPRRGSREVYSGSIYETLLQTCELRRPVPDRNRRGDRLAHHDQTTMHIIEGGLDDPRVIALLRIHLQRARAETAPGSAHALDLSSLRAPGVTFWSAWTHDDVEDARETLAGVGALKRLSAEHGEVKSMHTAEGLRRRGIGAALVRHIIAQAEVQGMTRLSLETGSWPYFVPARALYARHGFAECPPFGEYKADPNSVFMTLVLPGRTQPGAALDLAAGGAESERRSR